MLMILGHSSAQLASKVVSVLPFTKRQMRLEDFHELIVEGQLFASAVSNTTDPVESYSPDSVKDRQRRKLMAQFQPTTIAVLLIGFFTAAALGLVSFRQSVDDIPAPANDSAANTQPNYFEAPNFDTLVGDVNGTKLKRPPKTPDRAYPLVKNPEYAYAYDWEYRPG